MKYDKNGWKQLATFNVNEHEKHHYVRNIVTYDFKDERGRTVGHWITVIEVVTDTCIFWEGQIQMLRNGEGFGAYHHPTKLSANNIDAAIEEMEAKLPALEKRTRKTMETRVEAKKKKATCFNDAMAELRKEKE